MALPSMGRSNARASKAHHGVTRLFEGKGYEEDAARPVARTRRRRSLPGGRMRMAVRHVENVDDLPQRDELGDGPGQLQRLVVAEPAPEIRPEGVVHLVMVLVHAVRVPQPHLFAVGEWPALVVV